MVTCLFAGIHTYTRESALNKGTIIKVRVSETGIHKIPYDSLTAWGLDAQNVSILGYGGGLINEDFSQKNGMMYHLLQSTYTKVMTIYSTVETMSYFMLKMQ